MFATSSPLHPRLHRFARHVRRELALALWRLRREHEPPPPNLRSPRLRRLRVELALACNRARHGHAFPTHDPHDPTISAPSTNPNPIRP